MRASSSSTFLIVFQMNRSLAARIQKKSLIYYYWIKTKRIGTKSIIEHWIFQFESSVGFKDFMVIDKDSKAHVAFKYSFFKNNTINLSLLMNLSLLK